MGKYSIVDLINGLERYDGYTPEYYKSFTPTMINKIENYMHQGGRLLVSGSYIGSDMQTDEEKTFLANTLKVQYQVSDSLKATPMVNGLGMNFDYYDKLNDKHYAATHPDILAPIDGAICTMQYINGASAAVGYKGNGYGSFTMGFPFECIKNEQTRGQLMSGILKYLLDNK